MRHNSLTNSLAILVDTVTLEKEDSVENLVTSTKEAVARRADRQEKQKGKDAHENISNGSSKGKKTKKQVSESEMKLMEAVLESQTGFATNWMTQVAVLSHRALRNLIRKKTLLLTHTIAYIAIGIFIGLAYLRAEVTIQGIQNRAGSLFFQVALFSFAAISSIDLCASKISWRPGAHLTLPSCSSPFGKAGVC